MSEDMQITELDSLKQLATNKGVEFHPNIGLDKLKTKIAEFDAQHEVTAKPVTAQAARRDKARQEQMKLVRVRIACMDPAKREWQGEWLSVGNALLGFHTKYVLFDHEYHLTQFMVDNLKDKKFRMSKDVPDGKGGKYSKNFFPAAYNIEYLEPLSQAELDALAADQAKRGAVDK